MLNEFELERAKVLLNEVETKAYTVGCYYVICLFRSPITRHIERRYGLFGDCCEAEHFYKMLRDVYEDKIPTQYWIDSNVQFLSQQDHNLLTDTVTDKDELLEDLIREQREQM